MNQNARRQRTARDVTSNSPHRSRNFPSGDFRSDNHGASLSETLMGEEKVLPMRSNASLWSNDTRSARRHESPVYSSRSSIDTRLTRPESPVYSSRSSIDTRIPQMEDVSKEFCSSFRDQAALLYNAGQWDDLVRHMQTLVEITGPSDPNYSENLGIIGLALLVCPGQEELAAVSLLEAHQTSKETRQVGLNYLLSRAYFRQNKDEEGSAYSSQSLRDLWQESASNHELIFEEGYNLGLILLRNPRTKPEGRELLKHIQQQCDRLQPQNPVRLKALTALDSLRA